jgi:hypothetical protein
LLVISISLLKLNVKKPVLIMVQLADFKLQSVNLSELPISAFVGCCELKIFGHLILDLNSN